MSKSGVMTDMNNGEGTEEPPNETPSEFEEDHVKVLQFMNDRFQKKELPTLESYDGYLNTSQWSELIRTGCDDYSELFGLADRYWIGGYKTFYNEQNALVPISSSSLLENSPHVSFEVDMSHEVDASDDLDSPSSSVSPPNPTSIAPNAPLNLDPASVHDFYKKFFQDKKLLAPDTLANFVLIESLTGADDSSVLYRLAETYYEGGFKAFFTSMTQ